MKICPGQNFCILFSLIIMYLIYISVFTYDSLYQMQQNFQIRRKIDKVVIREEFRVNPFIGSSGYGHTTPGAKYPFGMIYLSPVSSNSNSWKYTGGYQHSEKKLYGIAHTAVSGTGIQLGLDFIIKTSINVETIIDEIASPAYYKAATSKTIVEVVAGIRYGIHRYHMNTNPSFLYFDDNISVNFDGIACVVQSKRHSVTIWAEYNIYLYATINETCESSGRTLKIAADIFDMHVAISYVDEDGAKKNYHQEHTNFNSLYNSSCKKWQSMLDKAYRRLRVDRKKIQQQTFDTALYHMMISPYVHNDVDGRFLGPDQRIHTTSTVYYTFLSTWDIYRTWGPLMCVMHPEIMRGIVDTSLVHYDITGVFPRWSYAGQETNCMPSMHSVTLVYQAIAFNLVNESTKYKVYRAYQNVASGRSTFTTTRRVNLELKRIVENDGILFAGEGDTQTVSQMLEYAIVWECMAKLSIYFNNTDDFVKFSRWARIYKRLFDKNTMMYTGIRRDGSRIYDSKPMHASNTNLFTEGSGMQWLFHVMHDIRGLISLIGREKALSALNTIFTRSGTSEVPDVTGLVGMYAHGNEPSHHVVFIYFLLEQPKLAKMYIDRILSFYSNQSDGLCGNDDAGQMSAWFVSVTLGMYPIDPTSNTFLKF